MNSLDEAIEAILKFRDERDWAQFHSVKNLAAALSVEVAELQELFLWISDDEINTALENPDLLESLSSELGDTLIFSLLLCDAAGVAPLEAIARKLEENRRKYPVSLARGSAKKYTELRSDTEAK